MTSVRGSFRDPSGFLFLEGGVLYRQVNHSYRENLEHLWASGLYGRLVESRRLVAHEEAPIALRRDEDGYRVLRPERLPFVSYPYEWCFGQLRAAALLTLEIQASALAHDMTLKDASAFNVQFRGSRPIFIDLLSFERYREGRPWVAYRQFCRHFLAPLLIGKYFGGSTNAWLRVHLDGIPLDLASAILPARSRFLPSMLLHVHLHAAAERRFAHDGGGAAERRVSRNALRGLVDSLRRAVESLTPAETRSSWSRYYEDCSYAADALREKEQAVGELLRTLRPKQVWDLGANTGRFSSLASAAGADTVAFDHDTAAVETCYQRAVEEGTPNLLPLVMDLANPTPALGWANEERLSLLERGPAPLVLALALVHHLVIANNVPLSRWWELLARLGEQALVEFVPKSDVQVRRMLAAREDVFADYTREGFEATAQARFEIVARREIPGTERALYHLRRRSGG